MRNALAPRDGERARFQGTFERFGTKRGWKGATLQTVLLKDIHDTTGTRVCDHLWFNFIRAFADLELHPGDLVQFDARVKEYLKGYFGWRDEVWKPAEVDYKLSHPTKVVKVTLFKEKEV
jgi:hypothetical protein